MDKILEDFLKKIIMLSSAGAGGPSSRDVIKIFDLPRHGVDKDAIDRYLLPNPDRRKDAITRILGFRDFKTHDITSVGRIYLSSCVNQVTLIKNQFKKWHFPNPFNKGTEIKDFDLFPYWIVLEFLCLVREELGTVNVTDKDFIVFILTIKKREEIKEHVKAYIFTQNNGLEYSLLLSSLPEDPQVKYNKGYWKDVFTCGFFEPVKYNDSKNIISLVDDVDCEYIKSMIEHFYDSYSERGEENNFEFLQNEIEDEKIFPSPHISPESIGIVSSNIDNTFNRKNILLKGVPGTGKSTLLSNIVERKIFKLKDPTLDTKVNPCLSRSNLLRNNVLRINIHSASSNSDLMQGIGIATDDQSRILYSEKRGLILKHIEKACFQSSLPFVLILEEIQENSLNELIGDLIYLIETTKRAKIQEMKPFDTSGYTFGSLVNYYIEHIEGIHYVELPSLINPDKIQKMIIPDNLYIFCTSNYRDDKKVIEDNLLRRFSVIELYPQYQSDLGKDKDEEFIFKSESVSKFLFDINDKILKLFDKEMHADRFLIGQSNWLPIVDGKDVNLFYEALLKVFIEFKEIKELEFQGSVDELLIFICENKRKYGEWIEELLEILCPLDKGIQDYKSIVTLLQNEIYKDVFSANNFSDELSEDLEIS